MKKNSVKVPDASDCCIGSIVWVRRRNGSWWPGKILGSDGLSASNLMSPRSGTPVKLLGREDASVDWYNLEKSKRVKAFRCGEFDDCIQKVEASLGLPPKKREKYARREDAILHALELEKEAMEKKYVNTEPVCNEAECEISEDEKKTSMVSAENSARLSDDELEWRHRSKNNSEHAELASGGDERSNLTPDCMDGMSKWKLKRKRNSRVRGGNNFSKVSFPRGRGESFGPEDFVTAKTMLADDNTEQDDGDDDIIDWEESSWNEFLPSHGDGGYYWADHHQPSSSNSSYLLEHDSFRRLMDIELKVVHAATSSSNQRQHIPLISLLSKLNGHAIIGHPILVEPLENSSSETLLLSSRQVNDETTTNSRVPHPRPPATTKKLSSRKVQKKIRLSSSSIQKTKTLSSIGVGTVLVEKINGKGEEEKGFIKEGVLTTGVACIPVKLVFSRLHEELVG